jgi:hypothetical protein
VLNDFPLFLAFALKDLITAADKGLALRLGAAFFLVGDLRLLTGDLRVFRLRTAIGFSYSFAHVGARIGPGAQCFKAVHSWPPPKERLKGLRG